MSPRRPPEPVRRLKFRFSLEGRRGMAQDLKKLYRSGRVKDGAFEVSLEFDDPSEAVAGANDLLAAVRKVLAEKGFKDKGSAQPQK